MQRLVRPFYQVRENSITSIPVGAVAGILETLGWNIIFASAYVVYGTFVSTLHPVSGLAWMSTFASITAFIISRGTPSNLATLRNANPVLLIVQAASSALSFIILFALLSRERSVSVLALILIIPVINVLVAAVVFGDRASWAWWAVGFLLCLAGTVSFRFYRTSVDPAAMTTVMLAVAYVGMSVASSITRSALTRRGASAAGLTLVGYASTAVLAFAYTSATGLLTFPTLTQVAALFYLGVVPTAAGAIGIQRVLDRIGYPTVEAIGMTKPFLGHLFAMVLALASLGPPPQTLNVMQLAGLCAAAIGAAVCVTFGRPTDDERRRQYSAGKEVKN